MSKILEDKESNTDIEEFEIQPENFNKEIQTKLQQEFLKSKTTNQKP